MLSSSSRDLPPISPGAREARAARGRRAAGGANGPTNRYVRCGASPRAAQALLLGAKVKAVTEGRFHVSYADVQHIGLLALRHRVLLNFEAEADRVQADDIVKQILELTPTQPMGVGATS